MATKKTKPEAWSADHRSVASSCWSPPFRGEIWENAAGIGMGRGYSNQGAPFDIESACYLKEPFQAIKDPSTRMVVLLSAVQTLKTFVLDETTAYMVQHRPGGMGIYFPEDNAARDHARGRLMPRLRSIPGLAEIIEDAERADRFDVSTQELYLPGMVMRIWPLNASTTARMTLRYVFISDGYLSGRSGLIAQAKRRATQHPDDKLIVLESQGGEAGDDVDVEFNATDMRRLHVVCPRCRQGQPFAWHRVRGDDFEATLPDGMIDEPARMALTALLKSQERCNCGMQRGPEEAIKEASGDYIESEVQARTYYECYHCGEPWHDNPETRKALDESCYYVPSKTALPGNVGFTWPSWAGQRLAWGGEQNMLGYLRAKRVYSQFGNIEPLKQWHQKSAGVPWHPSITQTTAPIITTSQAIAGQIPDERCRVLTVDVQQDDVLTAATGRSTMGNFYFIARAIDKDGNQVQLERGFAKSWQEVKEVQKRLQISNQNVGVDGGNWREEVIDLCAANIELVKTRRRKHGRWIEVSELYTYTVLVGRGNKTSWRWQDGRHRAISPQQPQARRITWQGRQLEIKVPLYEWSNLSIKDQLAELIRGGVGRPQFTALPREQLSEATRLHEVGNLTYTNQMDGEFRAMKKNGQPEWQATRPDVHYKDCECMTQAMFGLGGFMGITAAPEGEANQA